MAYKVLLYRIKVLKFVRKIDIINQSTNNYFLMQVQKANSSDNLLDKLIYDHWDGY